MTETLKRLDELCAPDPRRLHWKILNEETGAVRDLTLDEHYSAIAQLSLAGAPDSVVDLWETARNILLYSWFVYRFTTVAELQAYSVLEFALRDRLGHGDDDKPPTLAPLLREAKRNTLLTDDTFRHLRERGVYTGNSFIDANIDPAVVEEGGHIDLLCSTIPMLRNSHAHGSTNLWPSALASFWIVRAAIEALYARRAS